MEKQEYRMLTRAVEFAARAHDKQVRKITGVPYIVHPMEACAIVAGITDDEEVMAAAVLHDVIEDTPVTAEELEAEFGEKVAKLVMAESENKREELPAEDTWKVRKQETIDFLRNEATRDEKIVALGDKLANMRAIYRDYQKYGEEMWKNFAVSDKGEQYWYYKSLAEVLGEELGETEAWKEMNELVKKVWE